MKKLLGIVVLGLLLSENAHTKEEIYLRCIPEVIVVRDGDMKKGSQVLMDHCQDLLFL